MLNNKLCTISKSPTAGENMVNILLIDNQLFLESNGERGKLYENTVSIEEKEKLVNGWKTQYKDLILMDHSK